MTDFTQERANEIAAALAQADAGAFTSAVAFAPGIEPTAEAVASLSFPADFAIDATSFTGGESRGRIAATGGGQQAELALIKQGGAWKIDSTGSSETITGARTDA